MKINKLIVLAATAFSVVGCSSSKLPLPEGDKTPLNQNGIPAELALAMARENQKMISPSKPVNPVANVSSNVFSNAPAKTPNEQAKDFSHAKISNQPLNNSSVQVSKKTNTVPNITFSPFSSDRNTKTTNAIVSDKVKTPVIASAPLSNTVKPLPKQNNVVSVAPTVAVTTKLNMTPIKLKVDLGKEWVALPGSTLRGTLIKWSAEDKCNSTDSWKVIWPVDYDYPIDSRLSFNGNFYEVITKLFDLYKKAQQPLYIDIYKSQCILSVSSAANSK